MQRQLIKMLVTAEQGRTVVFHAARVLEAADAGDAHMAKVLRILTPLIKFRTCRDARKVTGDAMEVRGGSGYIEEWSDARVLRDAHLGSIWEGTSNIVALDVARATRREGALDALRTYIDDLTKPEASEQNTQQAVALFKRAADFLDDVVKNRANEIDTRAAASAVYNATSAVFMCWEAAQLRDAGNPSAQDHFELAQAVIAHKLSTRDPLVGQVNDSTSTARILDRAFRDVTAYGK